MLADPRKCRVTGGGVLVCVEAWRSRARAERTGGESPANDTLFAQFKCAGERWNEPRTTGGRFALPQFTCRVRVTSFRTLALRRLNPRCPMLNRSAFVVRAKQPFLDWLRGLPDPVDANLTLADINQEPTVYLLPVYEDDEERNRILARHFDLIFASELAGWWTKETDWPAQRDLRRFRQWFDVSDYSVIEDLVDAPMVDDD